MIPRLLSAFLLATIALNAQAATLAGVTLPDTYPVEGRTLALNGIGLRTLTVFEVKIYVAGLYLARPSHDAQAILASPEPKVVLLQFLHAGTKAEVEKQYRAGERNNCGNGGCDPADEVEFNRLVAAAPAVNPGDTSTYIFNGGHVRVYANNRLIADFVNKDLAFHLLEGFIGAHPPSADLKRQLLGLPQG